MATTANTCRPVLPILCLFVLKTRSSFFFQLDQVFISLNLFLQIKCERQHVDNQTMTFFNNRFSSCDQTATENGAVLASTCS